MVIKGKHGRVLEGINAKLVFVIGALMSIFQVYFVSVGVIDPWIFRAGHLSFGLVIIFLITPASKKSPKNKISIMDLTFAAISILIFLYIVFNLDELNMRAGVSPTTLDTILSITTLILVLEAARRFFGPILPMVAVVFIIYAFFGYKLGGAFRTPNYSFQKISSYLFSTTGIYGSAIATSATYVYLFVLFGVFLVETGVGDVFMDLAKGLTGGLRGGPAKVAVLSSCLFGSISGSASSNVVTTGTFTIPLMKSVGYKGEFAAAVETTASIGGLFMPPIMGAGGFLMADILQIPYREVAISAFLPATLYYIVLFMLVDFEAVKLNIKKIPKKELPDFKKVFVKRGYLLLPVLVLLISLLGFKTSAIRAALWSMIASVVVSWFNPENRIGVKKLIHILSEGSRQGLNIVGATACAGIIIGIVQMTGFGLTLSSIIMHLGGTSIFLSLVLAMIVTVILGMGLPITATYITASAILAPALIRLEVEPIAAHMFIYFFSAASGMTPPVCVTAFAAAGLAGENPMRVGWQSVRLGWAAFILPYMFVYGPELLLIGEPIAVVIAVITAIVGVYCVVLAVHGILKGKLLIYERIIIGLAGLFLIDTSAVTNYMGLALIAVFIVLYRFNMQRVTTN